MASKGTQFKSPKLRKQPASSKTLERAVEEETKGRAVSKWNGKERRQGKKIEKEEKKSGKKKPREKQEKE